MRILFCGRAKLLRVIKISCVSLSLELLRLLFRKFLTHSPVAFFFGAHIEIDYDGEEN